MDAARKGLSQTKRDEELSYRRGTTRQRHIILETGVKEINYLQLDNIECTGLNSNKSNATLKLGLWII